MDFIAITIYCFNNISSIIISKIFTCTVWFDDFGNSAPFIKFILSFVLIAVDYSRYIALCIIGKFLFCAALRGDVFSSACKVVFTVYTGFNAVEPLQQIAFAVVNIRFNYRAVRCDYTYNIALFIIGISITITIFTFCTIFVR